MRSLEELEETKKQNAAQLLFLNCLLREVRMQFSLVTMLRPSQRTVAPPPCLPLDIKDSLKRVGGF
jgi:hypothetical protein